MSGIRRVSEEDLDRLGPEAVLVDVREPGEFAGRHLAGSANLPLSRLEELAASLPKGRPLVVVCQSGARARGAAQRLLALGFREVGVVEGGLSACAEGRLVRGAGGTWAMERQVRMAAGLLILAGAALAWLFHPAFWLLSVGVGAGLVFSAATDTCGMAAVLARMPWNAAAGSGCRKAP